MTDTTQKPTWYSKESLLPFLYLIVALLALRWTLIEPYVVPTPSMEPTLKVGDRLYALKCAYDVRFPFTEWILFRTGQVKRGDVILFRSPLDPAITFVKRAVGLPGDKIEFRHGVLYVNGAEQPKEIYPNRSLMYDLEDKDVRRLFVEKIGDVKHYLILYDGGRYKRDVSEVTIPQGYVFASGDNRDNSSDSREWGLVPIQNLKGRGMFIWFSSPVDRPGTYQGPAAVVRFVQRLVSFWDWRIRWERIGTRIT